MVVSATVTPTSSPSVKRLFTRGRPNAVVELRVEVQGDAGSSSWW